MLKIAAEGLMPCLKACVQASSNTQSVCQRLAPTAVTATQKCLSQSQISLKKYSIKDHSEFDQKVMKSDHPVIVDFHAEWCDPCKKLTPRMAALLENSDEVDLAIIDVETNAELVDTFNVQSVPTVFAIRNGEVVHKIIGLVEANILKSMIDKLKSKNSQNTDQTESALQ